MRGQWYSHGWLVNGTTVYVGGPIKFDANEAQATIEVTVTQGGSSVTGNSDPILASSTGWMSWAADLDGNAPFKPGKCEGSAKATIDKTDGTQTVLQWDNVVTLD